MMQVRWDGVSGVKKCNKDILLAVGVNCTARDTVKVKFTGVPSINLRYIGSSIAKPHKTSSECCTACYKSLLHVLWCWLDSEVLVRLMSCVTCGASETCGLLSVQIRIHSLVPRPCAFIACSTKFTQKAWACSSRDMCRSICHNHFTENQWCHRMC